MNEREIFDAALALADPTEQAAFLERACGDDTAQSRRLHELLEAQRRLGSFLESPPVAALPTLDQPPIEQPGTQIGPYKLLQQIGEGGMGVVYMAEQTEPVQRKVALKVIKPGMDSRQIIARFEAERQALAMMDHVNIARVLDAGATESGRPYFVMELVHGVPITKYCDDNRLTPRQRLELFVPVCQAIQHAHQKGIIHRDIKPSNVMVTLYDGKPVPKVIDFGVAKATEQKLTERTLFTQYGTMVGTLEYMSPEQAEMSALGVDTRSDIYSLGVLLYELLTGSTPLSSKRMKEAAYAEILRLIKEEEPPKPSTRLSESGESLASISAQRHTEPAKLSKLMRGELDWIVMKTLEKDRNRRYETANAFAADVQRYLADETVQACPPSAGYRLRKFARRNKAPLAFTGLVLLILLTLTGGIGWNVRDRAARQTAVELEVSLALKEAEQMQEQAKWPEALSAARRAQGLLAGSGSDELRERVQQLRNDLEMVLRLEDIPLLASEIKENKFDYENADRAYAQAFSDFGIDVAGLSAEEAAARIRARPGVAVPLAAALDDWVAYRRRKDKAGSLALTALAQAVDPDPWRRQVRQAVKQKDNKALAALASSPELLRQPPTSLLVLARALRAGDLADAQIEVLRQAQRQYPGDFWINYSLGWALHEMGPPYRDEAISFRRAALAVRPQNSAVHNSLGVALMGLGKLDEAIACYRKAIELDPKNAIAHYNLGNDLMAQGKVDKAIDCYRKAIELDPKYVHAHNNLGSALFNQKKPDEAIAAYKKAIELDPKHANAYIGLGATLRDQKKLDDAIDAYRKAIELDPKFADAHNNLGALLCDDLKDYDKAVECFRTAITLDPKHANSHNNLALALRAQGKLDEAIACYRKLIELAPKNASVHVDLGNALVDKKELEEAIACFRKAIELRPKCNVAHYRLANALFDQTKLDDAIAAYHKAIELSPKSANAHYGLGNALYAQQKWSDAIAAYLKAIDVDPKFANAHYALGLALKAHGKLDDAIAAYRKAIKLDTKLALAHYNLGRALAVQKKLDEAIAAYKQAVEIDPKLHNAHYSLAWELTVCSELKLRDPKQALVSARRAVELDPKNRTYWQGLGYAEYRFGNWKAAVLAFQKVKELGSTGDSVEWFPLSMCYWQLGDKDAARKNYDHAVQWMEKNGPNDGFLRGLRAEAAELMGIELKKE